MDLAPFSNDGLMMGQDGNLGYPQQNDGEGPSYPLTTESTS